MMNEDKVLKALKLTEGWEGDEGRKMEWIKSGKV